MSKIAFIVEGEKTERQVINSFLEKFINDGENKNIEIEEIVLPIGTNIYTLYKKIKEYDFFDDIDIIDIVQENFKTSLKYSKRKYTKDYFSEIYLLFDYDGHANDTSEHDKIINEMLDLFNNETEMGKLLISYPMIEAVKDFSTDICADDLFCTEYIYKFSDYKSSLNKKIDEKKRCEFLDLKKYDNIIWNTIISNYLSKSRCLFDIEYVNYDYNYYINNITPQNIFNRQYTKYIKNYNKVMILSAIPEFIVDYIGENIFNENLKYNICK